MFFLDADPLQMWLHLVSEHACIMEPTLGRSLVLDMIDQHRHEHNGPCGIRNHDETLCVFDMTKVGRNLADAFIDDPGHY